jgi:hypothetical protein
MEETSSSSSGIISRGQNGFISYITDGSAVHSSAQLPRRRTLFDEKGNRAYGNDVTAHIDTHITDGQPACICLYYIYTYSLCEAFLILTRQLRVGHDAHRKHHANMQTL